MFFRIKKSGPREYLQIAHNRREKHRVRQDVIATIGRLDVLRASGALDSLLRPGVKFSEKLAIIDSGKQGESISSKEYIIGLPMIFGRLWKETGIKVTIEAHLDERKFRFPIERAIFMTVLHRLSKPGSDRAAEKWQNGYKIEGVEGIDLHQSLPCDGMAWGGITGGISVSERGDSIFATMC